MGDIGRFLGKNIDDSMSKEELLDIIRHLSAELARHNTPKAVKERVLGAVELLKQGATR